jgi:ELWxxDGT repeat protein
LALAACGSDDEQQQTSTGSTVADGGNGGAGGAPSDPLIESATWLLSDLERTPATEACWATLFDLEVEPARVVVGAWLVECGNAIETTSSIELSVVDGQLELGGEAVGSITERTLDVTLPDGSQIEIDLTSATLQFEYTSALRSYRATMTQMPDDRAIALDLSLDGSEDESVDTRLRAARLPEHDLVFAVSSEPASGTVSSLDPATGNCSYAGDADFFGADTFQYSVSSGALPATEATVSVNLAGVPDPPFANNQSVGTNEDTALPITLDAGDVDGDTVQLTIETQPVNGTLTGTFSSLTYDPDPDFFGDDSFTYSVSDGTDTTPTATVSITVNPVNDAPVALPQDVTTRGQIPVSILLTATDIDSTGLTYAIASQPANGTVSGSPPNVTYRANAGFEGDDSFTFTASDEGLTSAPATVTVHVLAPLYDFEELASSFTISFSTRFVGPSHILFSGYDSLVATTRMWNSDGTIAGTGPIHTIGLTSSSFGPGYASYFALGADEYYVYPSGYSAVTLYSGVDGSIITTYPNPDATNYSAAPPVIGRSTGINGSTAYSLVTWSGASDHICQIWATDGTSGGSRIAHTVTTTEPCHGVFDGGNVLYFIRGTDLMTFTEAAETPVLLTTIDPYTVLRWLGSAGGLHYWYTKYPSGSNTSVDLHRTDGTAAGTIHVRNIETAFIEYGLGNPAAYAGELTFTHRKSLWSSDGTSGGTGTVWTAPTSSYGGSGAINNTTAINGLLFMRVNTDTYGAEPWVYDGSTTILLADIDGTSASSMSTGAFAYDGHAFFGARGILYRSDGTVVGTEIALDVPTEEILGVVGGRLLVHGGSSVYGVFPN